MQVKDYISICQTLHSESNNGTFKAGVLLELLRKERDFLDEQIKKSKDINNSEMMLACFTAINEIIDDISHPADLP